MAITDEDVKAKIESVLKIYPKISPSMLQVGVGPATKPEMWKPVYYQMIGDGLIIERHVRYQAHNGHYRVATIVSLSPQYLEAHDLDNESGALMTNEELFSS